MDFYGGGITAMDPFAAEIAGLRSYFAKHARTPKRAYVLAWTYMPRDKGKAKYVEALGRILPQDDIHALQSTTGVAFRSVALRLLLRQHLIEHGFVAKLFHHAVYKRVMSTLILVFSKDVDPNCLLTLGRPLNLVDEPCCVYDSLEPVPRIVSLFDL